MKNLLIAPSGHDTVAKVWHSESKKYDIAILDYTKEGVKLPFKPKYIQQKQGFKWKLIKEFLTPEIIDKYDYFFFPDDDIIVNSEHINKLFEVFSKSGLQLAQPSLTVNSSCSWRITKRKGVGVRKTSHVEVMCPIMTKDAVKKLIHTFDINNSSWGIDLLWSHLLDYKGIGIIDTVSVYHSKPVGSRTLYSLLDKNPGIEMQEIIEKYKLKEPFFVEL
jgi:hypothetical protein